MHLYWYVINNDFQLQKTWKAVSLHSYVSQKEVAWLDFFTRILRSQLVAVISCVSHICICDIWILNFLLTLSIKSANLYSLGSLTQRNGALYLIASSLWIAVFQGNVDNSWRFGIRYSLFWTSNREFMRSYEMTLIIAKLRYQ